MALIADGMRTDGSEGQTVHGVECVGNMSVLLYHPLLTELPSTVGDFSTGVYLTGFKLESTVIQTENLLDSSKLVPMLNGDTMTLTNSNKSGTITFAAARTAAGIGGGDLISICDFLRSQGDSTGGTLTVTWKLNGNVKQCIFYKVTVRNCPPLLFAGNDLPDYSVRLNYAYFHMSDYPV